ncbi:VacB/RNase II family 3'-5' exoribonuclease [bacterium]|nr:VacB/RNase II family 3'-5' exoribonuclease [bacterium]
MKKKHGKRAPRHLRKSAGRGRATSRPPATAGTVGQVLAYMEDRPRVTLRVKDLIVELATSPRHEREIRDAVNELLKLGKLQRVKGKKIQLADEEQHQLITGKLDMAEGGFGFVRPSSGEGEDIFVPPSKLRGANHGDQVEVSIEVGFNGKTSGRVLRVVERDDTPVTGRLIRLPGRGGLVYPDNPRIPGPIEIPEAQLRGAKEDDRVQVDVSSERRTPHGRVTRVFGPANDPRARYKALIATYKFREKFARAALDEAEQASEEVTEEELTAGRMDLRDRMIVTIDPESAHDFDDALSLIRKKDGSYELGVHIADVSWYVREGGMLDKEARMRGTSVYTSHGTLPMLPERLSSDLCSLREGVDRRAVTVFIPLKATGEVNGDARVTRSVIRSRRRFTYAQVQELLEETTKKYGDKLPALRSDSLPALVHHLGCLTDTMRRLRFKQGGLNLEVPEYEVEVNDQDEAVGIQRREVHESNHLVEECMLAANRAVTEFAIRQRGTGPKAFVYRIHDLPDPEKLQDVGAFVMSLGLEWPLGRHLETVTSKQINSWLQSLEGHPLKEVIEIHALRAMAKAAYDTQNIGHFGLGFANYTHFTSPIRRYPDLEVHRILMGIVEGGSKHGKDVEGNLQRTCDLASERERAAQEMERHSLRIRQAEYFSKMIGEVFEGMVTRAVPKGVFIDISETGAQGMILADDLGSFFFDRKQQTFVEIGGKEMYRPGKRLPVRILSADPDLGRVELEPA